jgi:hypothetical protein
MKITVIVALAAGLGVSMVTPLLADDRRDEAAGFSVHAVAAPVPKDDGSDSWGEYSRTAALGATALTDDDVQLYFPDPLRLVLTPEAAARWPGPGGSGAFVVTLGGARLFAGEAVFIGSARAIRHPVAYLDRRGEAPVLWIHPVHVGRFDGPRVSAEGADVLAAEVRGRLADHFRHAGRLYDPDAARRKHPGFFAAIDALAAAEDLLARGQAAAADARAGEGLSQLGSAYAPRETLDDTGQKLAAAAGLRGNRPGDAAEMVLRMLRERIALYRIRHPDTPRETRWLGLQLRLDDHASRVGEPLRATVELVNAGDEPLLVNGRLALNAATAPRGMREVWFEVKGPGEQPRAFQAKVKIGPPQPGDAVELAAGASLSGAWNLAEYFDLGQPGAYWIRANYGSAPLADSRGHAVWATPLTFGWLIAQRRP